MHFSQVLEAAKSAGSFNIVGHGVPCQIFDTAVAKTKEFFALPEWEKRKCKGECPFTGYTALSGESVNKVYGRGDTPDLREVFGTVTPSEDPNNIRVQQIDGFSDALIEYGKWMSTLDELLHRLLTKALSLEIGYALPDAHLFDGKDGNGSLLRASHYPVCSHSAEQERLPGHSDWSTLTIVYPLSPGLEEVRGSEWVAVPVQDYQLHVNLGDVMHIWSNGVFKNNIHRVCADQAGRPRLSIAYFAAQGFNGKDGTGLSPVFKKGELAKFDRVSVMDYLNKNLRRYV